MDTVDHLPLSPVRFSFLRMIKLLLLHLTLYHQDERRVTMRQISTYQRRVFFISNSFVDELSFSLFLSTDPHRKVFLDPFVVHEHRNVAQKTLHKFFKIKRLVDKGLSLQFYLDGQICERLSPFSRKSSFSDLSVT